MREFVHDSRQRVRQKQKKPSGQRVKNAEQEKERMYREIKPLFMAYTFQIISFASLTI